MLEANPLDAVTNAERRVGVMARGHWWPERTLTKMLNDVAGDCEGEQRFVRSQLQRKKDISRYLRENDPLESLAFQVATDLIVERGIARFKEACVRMQKREPGGVCLTEGFLDGLGSRLLLLDRKHSAMEVLTMNAEMHPQSASAYGRLAEACLKNGEQERAAYFQRQALEKDPNYTSSFEPLNRLRRKQ